MPALLKAAVALLVASACFALQGCGYRFPGDGQLPGHIKSICIKPFKNRTSVIGIESIITNDLIYEFTRTGFTTPGNCRHAGAVLTGTIESAESRTTASHSSYVSAERRITIVVDVQLVAASGKIIRSISNLSDYQDYAVSDDKTQTEENKKSAAAILFERMAQRIYYQLTANF